MLAFLVVFTRRAYLHFLTCLFFFFKDFIYLFMRDTERMAETQAEGEAGSMQEARYGTRSRDHALGQRQVPNRGATQGSSGQPPLNSCQRAQNLAWG